MVVGMDGVERDPEGRPFHDLVRRVCPVERNGIEALDAVPERDVRRCRLLRLQRDHAPDGLGDVQPRPLEEQLAGEGGTVQREGSEGHACMLPSIAPARPA